MEMAKLSSKGQVVVPLKIRKKLGFEEGVVIGFEVVNDMLLMKKIDVDLVGQFEKSLANLKLKKIKRVA